MCSKANVSFKKTGHVEHFENGDVDKTFLDHFFFFFLLGFTQTSTCSQINSPINHSAFRGTFDCDWCLSQVNNFVSLNNHLK